MRIDNRAAGWLWLFGGLLIGGGIASLPSIGWILIAVGTVTLLLTGTIYRGRGWPFAFLGLAIPLLWVAWRHRGGPGERCWETDSGTGCEEILDPTPWLTAGLILLLLFGLALGIIWVLRRRQPPAS